MTELEKLQEKWASIQDNIGKLDEIYKRFNNANHVLSKTKAEYVKELKHVEYRLKQLTKNFDDVTPSDEESKEIKQKLQEACQSKLETLAKSANLVSESNGLYLNIILGKVNVALPDQESRFKYKCQYENFKLLVNGIIFMLTLISLGARYRFIDATLHFLLVWYHCTLTIRESILIVNGSRIKGWWRALQFITTIKSGLMIVWPDGLMYDEFRVQYLAYILYTSFLQFLQFYYQQGVLYRLRTLGERYDMDITIQGFSKWMWKGLSFLLPFLCVGYAFQFYNAQTLFKLSNREECEEWQVKCVSFIFIVIFIGNSMTLVRVLQQKLKEKIKDEIKKNICKYTD